MDAPNLEWFILAGLGIWIVMGIFIARVGGWASLASVYGYSGEFQGEWLRFQSARMRWGTNYGNCLTFGPNRLGVCLSTLIIFRLGHPPLFIPWTDISVSEQRGRWFNSVVLRFRRAPSIPLQISEQLARWLADRAGTSWPKQS